MLCEEQLDHEFTSFLCHILNHVCTPTDSDTTDYETGSDGEVYIKPKARTMTKRNVRGRGAF